MKIAEILQNYVTVKESENREREGRERDAAWGYVLNTNPDALSLFTASPRFILHGRPLNANQVLQFNNGAKWWIVLVISNGIRMFAE